MNNTIALYDDIFSKIQKESVFSRQSVYRAINISMVHFYWKIGCILSKYIYTRGMDNKNINSLLKEMSKRLEKAYGKSFSVRTLRQIIKFVSIFPNYEELCPQLTWSHYRLLINIQNSRARQWYLHEAAASSWSSRQLERQISTLYYERILASKNKTPVKEEAERLMLPLAAEDFIKDPYVLEFLDLKEYPVLRESDLEKALIDKLQDFLLELGRGFCFVSRQKRMRYEDEDFYIDLVFYHSVLKCHVLIDLKIGKLTHGDIGQMDSYIRMFDSLYRNADDNQTIGIILCSQKNEAIVKYSMLNESKNIFASKYRLELPTVDELRHEIESERKKIEEYQEKAYQRKKEEEMEEEEEQNDLFSPSMS